MITFRTKETQGRLSEASTLERHLPVSQSLGVSAEAGLLIINKKGASKGALQDLSFKTSLITQGKKKSVLYNFFAAFKIL